jgi:bacillopeptidase F
LTNVLENTALEPTQTLWIINGIAATVPVASLNGLAHRAGVDVVYLNETVELPPEPVLTGAPGNPPLDYWNISEIRATDLWAFGYYGTGVVVATMDTGVDANHADIGPKWRGGSNSWYDPNGQHATPFDASGHGTGVMGLIVGGNAGGFDIGVAPDAQWISVKIFNDRGQSKYSRIHQGFQWLLDPDGNQAADDAPDIVNSSWVLQGTQDQCFGEFAADIAALRAAGIAVVFSAGNTGPGDYTSMSPANEPGSLSVGATAVGATDSPEGVITMSSRGPSPIACGGGIYPKLAAPGKDVLTAGLTTNGANPTAYAFSTGTSFAAPHVAGAIAVLKSAFPDKSMTEIESAIRDGAVDLGAPGPDNDSGAGLVDVVEAYMLLGGSTPTDADQDGVPDSSDQCADTPAGESVDANGCSASQLDSDNDGVSDALDQCPGTPAGTEVDANGCAVEPPDTDQDGVPDSSDQCANTPAGEPVDGNGCSASQRDSDGDGVNDALDQCSGTPAGTEVDTNGCPVEGDVTIVVTQASYNASQDKVTVRATSDLGKQADLSVTFTLADDSVTNSIGMAWKRKNGYWESSIRRFARNYGSAPVSVTVSGTEGSVSAQVQ